MTGNKMKKTFALASSVFLLMSSAQTSFAAYTHEIRPEIWPQGRSSVTYQVQSTFDATTKTQIQTAMDTWNSALPSGNFLYKSTTETNETVSTKNQINTITKNPAGTFSSVATNYAYLDASNRNRVLESDIAINTSFTFANSARPNDYDIQSVITHELGHTLRLGESLIYNDTMYHTGRPNTDYMRTLTIADKEAAQVSVARWKSDVFRTNDAESEEYDSDNGTDKVIVRAEHLIAHFEKNQLVNESDVIISGTVLSQEVQKDFKGFPVTDTFIQVQTVYKGEPTETVEVRVDGGETDDMIYLVDNDAAPTFEVGEEVVVFLSHNKGSRPDKDDFGYYVVGHAQGKFNIGIQPRGIIENNSDTHSFNFNNLQDEIDNLEKYNEENDVPSMFLPEGQESDI